MVYLQTFTDYSLFQNGMNALHLAAKEGHVEVVSELINQMADVSAATKVTTFNLIISQGNMQNNAELASYNSHNGCAQNASNTS